MWQTNAAPEDYRYRIKLELSAQINAQFVYFLLQESIRLLEQRKKDYKKTLSWFSRDYQHQKSFIRRSRAALKNAKHLATSPNRFQLSRLFTTLAEVHRLLREYCTDEAILAFVAASDEARRYNDFSGQVHYAINLNSNAFLSTTTRQ